MTSLPPRSSSTPPSAAENFCCPKCGQPRNYAHRPSCPDAPLASPPPPSPTQETPAELRKLLLELIDASQKFQMTDAMERIESLYTRQREEIDRLRLAYESEEVKHRDNCFVWWGVGCQCDEETKATRAALRLRSSDSGTGEAE